jgi:hypothetical protein
MGEIPDPSPEDGRQEFVAAPLPATLGSESNRRKRKPMPPWERLGACTIFGAMFFGTFGCICPFEVFHSLTIPAAMLLAALFPQPSDSDASIIGVAAYMLTGGLIGFAAGLIAPAIRKG